MATLDDQFIWTLPVAPGDDKPQFENGEGVWVLIRRMRPGGTVSVRGAAGLIGR
jgi:hypothetical protein